MLSWIASSFSGPALLALVAFSALALSEAAWRVGESLERKRGRFARNDDCPCARALGLRFGGAVVALALGLWAGVMGLSEPASASSSLGVFVGAAVGLLAAGLLASRACQGLESAMRCDAYGPGAAAESGGSITDRAA